MASIIREITVNARPADVWDALRDFGAVHERLAPGFVIDSKLDGDDTRMITFFNGATARELRVAVDDDSRRLAYTVVEGPLQTTHHNASAQVFIDGDDRSRFVWITDVLPDDAAVVIAEMMDRGIGVIKETLESDGQRRQR